MTSKKETFTFKLCDELWRKDQLNVKCSICKKVIHGKNNCSLLSIKELSSIINSGSHYNRNCPSCTAEEYLFHSLMNNDFITQFHPHIRNSDIFPDPDIQ